MKDREMKVKMLSMINDYEGTIKVCANGSTFESDDFCFDIEEEILYVLEFRGVCKVMIDHTFEVDDIEEVMVLTGRVFVSAKAEGGQR
jgi:hypothetical protein